MKLSYLFLFLLAILPTVLLADNRTLTITAPAVVAPGQSFPVPCTASTIVAQESVAYFYVKYSTDGGTSWTTFCADATTGTSVTRTPTIVAGGTGTTVAIGVEIVYRSPAGDVDFTGSAMNYTAWVNWEAPPTKYVYVLVNNAALGMTVIPTTTYNAGQTVVVTAPSGLATGTATVNNTVTVSSGANVVFQAGGFVDLKPGFHAASGSIFFALSDLNLGGFTDLTDSDHDGLPDAWEMLYFGHLGVDPNADPDGDGISNAAEYRAGTNPTLNENANVALPSNVQVVVRIPKGQYQGVKTDWSIIPVP